MKKVISFEFRGNENGCKVKKMLEGKGDGDISTSKDGTNYAKLEARMNKVQGSTYAWDLKLKYYAMEPSAFNYDNGGSWSKSSQDGLYFEATKRIDLSGLEKSGYKLVIDSSFGDAMYKGWWKGKKTGWNNWSYNDYKTTNKVQAWLPMGSLKAKIDDSGNELKDSGNIGVAGNVVIIYHYESTAIPKGSTPAKTQPTTTATPTDINSFIKSLSTANLTDGFEELPILNSGFISGREGTYVRGVRVAKYNENVFKFPRNNSNYYLGKILLVDDNDTFFSKAPTELPLAANQRKPIEIIAKFGNYTITPKDLGYSTGVVPYEKDMAIMIDKLISKAKSRATAESWRLPLLDTQPAYYNYDHEDGINIGGTIKGVSFGANFSKAKSITILEYRQPLFSISLNDTDIQASDYIQNVSLKQLQTMCTSKKDNLVKSPAIIETIYYGKTAYIIATNEKSGITFNVGDYLKDGKCGGSDKWQFQAYINGGAASQLKTGYLNRDQFQDLVNNVADPLKEGDIDVAVPIEFEATHLSDRHKVKLDILPYYRRYIEKVNLGVTEHNSGASMDVKISWLEPVLRADKSGYDYYPQSKSGNLNSCQWIKISPWSLAIEVDVSIKGVDSEYDFNYFIPNVTFEKLRVKEDGTCELYCNSTGSNYWSAKNVTIDPMPTGCYLSKDNSIKGVTQYARQYGGNTEAGILKKFFEWCEMNASCRSGFSCIGAERDDMSGNSRG